MQVVPTQYGRCGAVDDGGFECRAAAVASERRCIEVELRRDDASSYLDMRMYANNSYCAGSSGEGRVSGVGGDVDAAPPELPTSWPSRPTQGEPVLTWSPEPIVMAGSRVVARRVTLRDEAVLELTADPDDLMPDYIEQIRAANASCPVDMEEYSEAVTRDFATLARLRLSIPAGGPGYELRRVTVPSGRSWLFLSRCEG